MNHENYTSFPSRLNRTEYINLIIENLIDIFEKYDKYISENIEIDLDLSKETNFEIGEKYYIISNIKNDLSIIHTHNNLNNALIEISMDIFKK